MNDARTREVNDLNFLNDYCYFNNDSEVWILKGLARNKDNKGNPDMHDFFCRRIINSIDDIIPCYEYICDQANHSGTIYRIYVSLNSRNVKKAFFNFQKDMMDIAYSLAVHEESDSINKIKKLSSTWKTELEQKRNRYTKRFLLDVDDSNNHLDELLSYLRDMPTSIHCIKDTVNGYAIVFNACDTRGLINFCKEIGIEASLHRDSMVFVSQFAR